MNSKAKLKFKVVKIITMSQQSRFSEHLQRRDCRRGILSLIRLCSRI